MSSIFQHLCDENGLVEFNIGTGEVTVARGVFDGAAGSDISTPDTAANSLTEEIIIEIDCDTPDWTPASAYGLASKYGAIGNRAWVVYLATDGTLRLYLSSDGTAIQIHTFTDPGFVDGSRHTLRFIYDPDDLTVELWIDGQFYEVLATAITGIFDSTYTVEIGSAGANGDQFVGNIYSVKISDDDGVRVNFDPDAYQGGNAFFEGILRPEIFTVPPDSIGAGWTDNSYGSYIGNGTNQALRMNTATLGAQYLFAITIDAVTQGGVRAQAGDTQTTGSSDLGHFEILATHTNGSNLTLQWEGFSAFIGVVSKLSVREVVSGYMWTINGNASVVGAAALRDLYIETATGRPFPIYASTGQAFASEEAGGLTFDANGRLRIVETLPSALTRTNELKDLDITDVSNWTVDAGVSLTYDEHTGWFRVRNISAGSGQAIISPAHTFSAAANQTFISAIYVRNADPVNDGIYLRNIVNPGGTNSENNTTIGTQAGVLATPESVTDATSTSSTLVFNAAPTVTASDDFYFKFPTIEDTTSYPAGVPPIVIPMDTPIGGNLLENSEWVEFPNGTTGGTVSIDGNTITITQGSNSVWMGAYKSVSTIVGKRYALEVRVVDIPQGICRMGGEVSAWDANPSLGLISLTSADQKQVITSFFDATATETFVGVNNGAAATVTQVLEVVSFREVTNGVIEVPAQVELPGGLRVSGPTGELIVYGPSQVLHQGVALTDEGYVADRDIELLLSEAVVHLDESTIVGSDLVTGWTNQGSGGSGYDLDTIAGTAANLQVLAAGWGRTVGSSSYFQTPSTDLLAVRNNFYLEWAGIADSWSSGTEALISQWDSALSFIVERTGSQIRFWASPNGVLQENVLSGVHGFSDGTFHTIGIRYQSGVVTFIFDGVEFAEKTLATGTSVFQNGASFTVGAYGGGANSLSGSTKYAKIINDQGQLAGYFAPSKQSSATAGTWTGLLGETWTINGNGYVNASGYSVVHGAGGVSIETAATQAITRPFTVFTAAKSFDASSGSVQVLHDARTGSDRAILNLNTIGTSSMSNGVSGISVAGVDSDPHVWTEVANTDATSSLEVSDIGSATGDTGALDWDYGQLFSNLNGSENFIGWIGELIIFGRELTTSEITTMQNYLQGKWL